MSIAVITPATAVTPAKRDVAYELHNIASMMHANPDTIPDTILARLNRYAEELQYRRVNHNMVHPAHISEQMTTQELAATMSGLARALADALDVKYPAKAGKGR